MTKPRAFEHRLLPPESPYLQVESAGAARSSSPDHLGRYQLRLARNVPECLEVPVERARLVSMMRDHGYGPAQEPTQYGATDLRIALRQLREPDGGWVPSISLRFERDIGLSLVMLGKDVGVGWVAAKVNVDGSSASLGGLFTPSASRFVDYYVAGGVHRLYTTTTLEATVTTEDGLLDVEFLVPPRWDIYAEGGAKFRVAVPGGMRWITLGHSFGGVRVGIRTLGIRGFFDSRFVFEVGAGAW